jgi:hypothetical protein
MTWEVSDALENFALLAMLSGVLLVAWPIVHYLKANGAISGDVLQAAWAGTGAKIGLPLFLLGLVLDTLSIGIRMSLPGQF